MGKSDIIDEVLEVSEYGDLISLRKLLTKYKPNLNCDVLIGEEYDLDEPDEVPLISYLIMNRVDIEIIELMLDFGLDLEITNSEGVGVIDLAIKFSRIDILRLCKSRGFNFNESKRKSGITPLMLASSFNDVEIVKYLLQEGVDVNKRDRRGMTALDYAKKMRHKKAQTLLSNSI